MTIAVIQTMLLLLLLLLRLTAITIFDTACIVIAILIFFTSFRLCALSTTARRQGKLFIFLVSFFRDAAILMSARHPVDARLLTLLLLLLLDQVGQGSLDVDTISSISFFSLGGELAPVELRLGLILN
jgi:hypothetical protein